MIEVDVHPFPDGEDVMPGIAPGISGSDLFKYLPVLAKLVEAFNTGTGTFSTYTPRGKRWITVSDQPPGESGMDDAPSPPGAFGIDAGFRKLTRHLDTLLAQQHQELLAAICRIERNISSMPTREEFDQAKQQLMTAITDATTRVTTDIQALRDQLNSGTPVTDQDLADLQTDLTAVGNIDPANPTPPAPARRR